MYQQDQGFGFWIGICILLICFACALAVLSSSAEFAALGR